MKDFFEFPFSIAYADTDAGGIVYHAKYIEIAERARMKWLNKCVPENDDVGFVIRDLSMKYIKPLKLGDDFVIECRLLKLGSASMQVEQKFVKDSEDYGVLNLTVAYIGKDLKPKRIPDYIIK